MAPRDVRVALIGDEGVGKSSIISALIKSVHEFPNLELYRLYLALPLMLWISVRRSIARCVFCRPTTTIRRLSLRPTTLSKPLPSAFESAGKPLSASHRRRSSPK